MEFPKACPKCKNYNWNKEPDIIEQIDILIPEDKTCKFENTKIPCHTEKWFCPKDGFIYCEAHKKEMIDFHSGLRGGECYHVKIP